MSIRSLPPKVSARVYAGTRKYGSGQPSAPTFLGLWGYPVAPQEGVEHRQHAAAHHERVRQTDVPGFRPAFYSERLPDGLSGVDPDQGYASLGVLVQRFLLLQGQHLVRVDGLPRQEEEVRVLARPFIPDGALRRYGREVGPAQVLPELPDPAVALEHRLRARLRVNRGVAGRDLVHPPNGRLVGVGEVGRLEPQRARARYEADRLAVVLERIGRPGPQYARQGERRVSRERNSGSRTKPGGDPSGANAGADRPQREGGEELPGTAVYRDQPRAGHRDDEGEVEQYPARRRV